MPLLRWTNLLLSATLLLQAPLLHARLLRIETIKSEPFGYDDARGKGGMMYEIGNLIASTAGMPYQNNVVPYARTVVSLRNGTADMVLRFGNEELTSVAHQVTPVLALPTMIFSRAASHILRFEDLQGATLATARSFPIDPRIAADPAIHVYLTDSNEHSVRMLFAGRVDAVLGSDLGIYGAASRQSIKLSEFGMPIPLAPQHFWLHFSRKTADTATSVALKNAVEKLERDGSINRIWKKYLDQAMLPATSLPALPAPTASILPVKR